VSAALATEAGVRGSTLALHAGELLKLKGPRGLKVTCESGHLWITEEDQPDDVWLAAGQRVWLVGEGLAVVEAKGDARLRID
jgi:hypothetical protein